MRIIHRECAFFSYKYLSVKLEKDIWKIVIVRSQCAKNTEISKYQNLKMLNVIVFIFILKSVRYYIKIFLKFNIYVHFLRVIVNVINYISDFVWIFVILIFFSLCSHVIGIVRILRAPVNGVNEENGKSWSRLNFNIEISNGATVPCVAWGEDIKRIKASLQLNHVSV